MELEKDTIKRQYKWHIFLILIMSASLIALALFTDVFLRLKASTILWPLRVVVVLVFLAAVISIVLKLFKTLDVLKGNGEMLEKIVEDMENNRVILEKINQNTRLSETAKAITFRDADKQSLREAVLDKLQQQDFEGTEEIINGLSGKAGYEDLAQQLRVEATTYRDATDQERIYQITAYIERLFESSQWARASVQVEKLLKAYPDSKQAKMMRQELIDKKQERKKILLNAWDDAVKRGDTDRSLEILRELDTYLTPNEGLALQEAARDVFRTKLHNLGVQFSLAISEKQWSKAFQTGQQIIHEFPNSKMAEEIREKQSVLEEKVRQ
ncbi:MAG: hypothetical protein KAS75_04180 [Planctomycetes bacterium]|nr:hypothetical protein [Planctomycetota bacterium]